MDKKHGGKNIDFNASFMLNLLLCLIFFNLLTTDFCDRIMRCSDGWARPGKGKGDNSASYSHRSLELQEGQ